MSSPASSASLIASVFHPSPSLMIPFAFANISETRVRKVLEEQLAIGKIERIDKTTMECDRKGPNFGKKIHRYFVHFEYWNKDWQEEAVNFEHEEGYTLKIVYDDPWFWNVKKCAKFTPKKEKAAPFVERGAKSISSGRSSVDHLKIDVEIADQ